MICVFVFGEKSQSQFHQRLSNMHSPLTIYLLCESFFIIIFIYADVIIEKYQDMIGHRCILLKIILPNMQISKNTST